MEGSCEHIEEAVADCRQGVVLQLGGGQVLTIPHLKTYHIMNHSKTPRTWTEPSVRSTQWKKDMIFGTRNVRSMYRASSLAAAVARELTRYK